MAAEPEANTSKASDSAGAGASPFEARPNAIEAGASSSELADSSGSGSAKGRLKADTSTADASLPQETGATASPAAGADASTVGENSWCDDMESSVSRVEHQLQQLALQQTGAAVWLPVHQALTPH